MHWAFFVQNRAVLPNGRIIPLGHDQIGYFSLWHIKRRGLRGPLSSIVMDGENNKYLSREVVGILQVSRFIHLN